MEQVMDDLRELHDIIAAVSEFNAAIGNPNVEIYQEFMDSRNTKEVLVSCLRAVSIEPASLLDNCDGRPELYREIAGVMYCIAILMAREAEEAESVLT